MDQTALRALQAPLKDRYREEPGAAQLTLRAQGTLGEGVSCSVATGRAVAEAGLHPLTGGDGSQPLLTTRWRSDRGDARIDPAGAGNLFSAMFPSRLSLRQGSGRFTCEDLRAGCPGMTAEGDEREYSFLTSVTSPDTPGPAARRRAAVTLRTGVTRVSPRVRRITLRGRISPPTGLDPSQACRGPVRLRVTRTARLLRSTRTRVNRSCKFATTIRLGIRLPATIRVTARFGGNTLLSPARARPQNRTLRP